MSFKEMVDQAAAHAAEHEPVALDVAIARLDKHCSGEPKEIWLAWCSVRQLLQTARAAGVFAGPAAL